MRNQPIDFLRGTLDLLVLKTLSWGPSHGYAIARWIEQCTNDAFAVEEGSLYPALYRLEEQGLITADWGVTDKNRRARFYRLTAAGKQELKTSQEYWQRYTGAVSKLLVTSPQGA